MSDSQPTSQSTKPWWMRPHAVIGLAALCVLGAWTALLVLTIQKYSDAGETTASKWGQFGDAFGSVNALFSGLALLGVVYAILLQREDIELQRKDFKASIDAQKEAAQAQASQVRIAAMAAALSAKQYISESLAEAAKHGSGLNKVKEQEFTVADTVEYYKKQMLLIDSLLDKDLSIAVPEYRSEKKA